MADSKDKEAVLKAVRTRYAGFAETGAPGGCGCSPSSTCCGPAAPVAAADQDETTRQLGYSVEELAAAPEGANLGLGCGNPQAIAALKPGEVVLDLGAGAGFDCFLAARAVGETGRVIGVDMTPEMVGRAREIARTSGHANVEFRLGEIEHLPVADNAVDVIISNCVINLSPDKPSVFREAFRVLKPGGRLAVSDVVAAAELPEEWLEDMQLLSACISGAATVDEVEAMLAAAGFTGIDVRPKEESREFIRDWEPGKKLEDYVLSASIQAIKP
jgi:arsenite methyltransferase